MTVVADPADCAFQFDPVGKTAFNRSCDLAKSATWPRPASPTTTVAAPAGAVAEVRVGDGELASFRRRAPAARPSSRAAQGGLGRALAAALTAAGYPAKADRAQVNKPLVVGILFLLVLYVTMVYGPIAAALVEMFPTRIRYTSMSLPYHIGNGWFGGFLPTTAFAMVAATGNIYYGLWYPIVGGAADGRGRLPVRQGRQGRRHPRLTKAAPI